MFKRHITGQKRDDAPVTKVRVKKGGLGRPVQGSIALGPYISRHKDRNADIFDGTLVPPLFDLKTPRQKVIIKIYTIDEANTVDRVSDRIEREARLWDALKHSNIAEFLGVCYDRSLGDVPGLVSPRYSNGSLSVFLTSNPDVDRSEMVYGIASGLNYLHRLTIVHGDLNPEHSIMVLDDGQPALVDFARSKNLSRTGYTTKTASTSELYRAPELVDSESNVEESNSLYTVKQDVYSFAMTMVFVLSGQPPFYSYGPAKLGIQQAAHGTQLRHTDYPGIGETHWKLGTRCWTLCPEARCSSATIMEVLSGVRTGG